MIANGIGDFDEDMIIEIIDSEEGLFFNKLEINNPSLNLAYDLYNFWI